MIRIYSINNASRAFMSLIGMSGFCAAILLLLLQLQETVMGKLVPLPNQAMHFRMILITHGFLSCVGGFCILKGSLSATKHFYNCLRFLIVISVMLPVLAQFLLEVQEESPLHITNEAHLMMGNANGTKDVCSYWSHVQDTLNCSAPLAYCDWCRSGGSGDFCSPLKVECAPSLIRFINSRMLCLISTFVAVIIMDLAMLSTERGVLKEMRANKKQLQKNRLVYTRKPQEDKKSQKFDKTEESQKPDKPEESEESVDSKPKEIRMFQRALDSLMSNHPTVIQIEDNNRIRYF